jgi:hypothetical protein
MCNDGSLPDSIVYHKYLDSIISTNTSLVFPKFSDTMGVLTCIRLSDTVTTVVNYNLENNLDSQEDYLFETYRRSQFTGPNGFFSSVTSPPKNYGPYTLDAFDPVGHNDEASVGPDTVFNKNYNTKYFGSNSGFYGSGDVTLNYLTTSTFTILTGSDNALIKLQAYTRLDVQLVYYWCPFSVLETKLTGFSVLVKHNSIVVDWHLSEPSAADRYEIEMSRDGKNFINLGQGVSGFNENRDDFRFVYSLPDDFAGSYYFRIKQTDVSGKIFYSEIRQATVKNKNNAKVVVYPNPTVSGINIRFATANGGKYKVEVVNSAGQMIFHKNYNTTTPSSLNIEWPHKPAPGIYYVRVIDMNNQTSQFEKLQIL